MASGSNHVGRNRHRGEPEYAQSRPAIRIAPNAGYEDRSRIAVNSWVRCHDDARVRRKCQGEECASAKERASPKLANRSFQVSYAMKGFRDEIHSVDSPCRPMYAKR